MEARKDLSQVNSTDSETYRDIQELGWRLARVSLSRAMLFFGSILVLPSLPAQLVPSADGNTVYDAHLKGRWLADFNLADSGDGKAIASQAGMTPIATRGAMNYSDALTFVKAMNSYTLNGIVGYLGHTTWTLPTSPVDGGNSVDGACSSTGPGGDRFGYGCVIADLAGLYDLQTSMGLQWPNTAVPIPDIKTKPFHNFQPYLYWTGTVDSNTGHGFHAFSFNTGFAGSNSTTHYMYVLPMVSGAANEYGAAVDYEPVGVGTLRASPDGLLIYDPDTNVTWLADANLSKSQDFGAQCANYSPPPNEPANIPAGIPCIAPDGSMAHDTVIDEQHPDNPNKWIAAMNRYQSNGWLGISLWQLPPDPEECGNFGCSDTPLGHLYKQLGLMKGIPVVQAPNENVGPFRNVQPYLYWSCGEPVTNPPCQSSPPSVPTQEWSFSFGNGFQGTDLQINYLYVTAYFRQTPAEALIEAIEKDLALSPELSAFLSQTNDITTAPNAQSKAGRLGAFADHVSAQMGKALTKEQAAELTALAQLI